MAAKVSVSHVSYGIGVQNRYSAFLDDEDGFGLSQVKPIAPTKPDSKRSNDAASLKQKNQNSASLSNGSKSSGSAKSTNAGRNGAPANKQEAGQKNQVDQGHRQARVNDSKRPQLQRHGPPPAGTAQRQLNNSNNNNKFGNSYQEVHAANKNQMVRNNQHQTNGNQNHQPTASHFQQNTLKENNELGQQGKPAKFNQRFSSNRPRQFQNDDRKVFNNNDHQQQQQHQQQDGQVNGSNTNFPSSQSIEEEKRRRQQKRTLDMKFKDPEKKEARRQQSNNIGPVDKGSTQAEGSQEDGSLNGQRVQKNRRDFNRNGPDEQGRNFKGPRIQRRRPDGETNGEKFDGQQNRPGPPRERIQRNRNGFGAGSRGSRGDEKTQERQKPIPNFSDKSDFPSLVS